MKLVNKLFVPIPKTQVVGTEDVDKDSHLAKKITGFWYRLSAILTKAMKVMMEINKLKRFGCWIKH